MKIGFNYLGKMGQIGNQMFQYASLRGISDYYSAECYIPNHKEIFDDGLGNKYGIMLHDLFEISEKYIGYVDNPLYYKETKFSYNEEVYELETSYDYCLVGFFQSEKYFKNIKNNIKEELKFKTDILEPCKEKISNLDSPISLHIRRGDFLTNSMNHYNLGCDYYKKALKNFDNDREVIVFSDDPEWCKEQSIFESNRFMISESSKYIDLCLMSLCSDFIIANSTFSWWGAYLADTGKVIAPSKWFGQNLIHNDIKDLYCEGWEII
jgi:hypothetical protein